MTSLGVIGHAATLELFERLCARNRFPAAVVLHGPPAVGKGTVARWLAARLLTGDVHTNPSPETHPDFLPIDLLDVVDVRETLVSLLQRTHERPFQAPTRVLLLKEIDRLSSASASLLLKTLEEAPPFTKFLLTATIRARVPATIRSRVFTRELAPLSTLELAAALRARGLGFPHATEVARLSGGRPGLALRLVDDANHLERYRIWARRCSLSRSHGNGPTKPLSLDEPALAEEFVLFLQGLCRPSELLTAETVHLPSAAVLRRTREATAMLRQHVPAQLVVEYVLGSFP